MKGTLISILALLTVVSVVLTIVIASAEFPDEIQYDFNRHVISAIRPLRTADLRFNSYYIAGTSGEDLYLANSEAPFTLQRYSANLEKREPIHLRIPVEERLYKKSIRVRVFDSTVFVTDGRSPRIYRGTLQRQGGECVLTRLSFDHLYFFHAVPISGQSVLLQGVSKPPYKNILARESGFDSSYLIADDILKAQVDGLFCTTGTLQYNPVLNLAVFVYSHRNEYLLLDTNLCLLDRGRTIDTFSVARVRSVHVQSGSNRQLIAPESQVNKYAFVSGPSLFVVSGLYTTRDDMRTAIHSSIIDVYNLHTRQYHYSFYLPDHEGNKFSSIALHGNTLYAIHDHYLKTFRLTVSSGGTDLFDERYPSTDKTSSKGVSVQRTDRKEKRIAPH